jgi:hypothetical protein
MIVYLSIYNAPEKLSTCFLTSTLICLVERYAQIILKWSKLWKITFEYMSCFL